MYPPCHTQITLESTCTPMPHMSTSLTVAAAFVSLRYYVHVASVKKESSQRGSRSRDL